MKVRIMGTKAECEMAQSYYKQYGVDNKDFVKSLSVSNLYSNRNTFNIYRVYVDIEYYDEILTNKLLDSNKKS